MVNNAVRFVVTRGQPVERSGYVDEPLVLRDQKARVGEALSLLRNTSDDGRVGRTDACHSDPRREVDDVIAVDIDQDAATGSLDEDRHGDAHTRGEFRAALRLQLLDMGPGMLVARMRRCSGCDM